MDGKNSTSNYNNQRSSVESPKMTSSTSVSEAPAETTAVPITKFHVTLGVSNSTILDAWNPRESNDIFIDLDMTGSGDNIIANVQINKIKICNQSRPPPQYPGHSQFVPEVQNIQEHVLQQQLQDKLRKQFQQQVIQQQLIQQKMQYQQRTQQQIEEILQRQQQSQQHIEDAIQRQKEKLDRHYQILNQLNDELQEHQVQQFKHQIYHLQQKVQTYEQQQQQQQAQTNKSCPTETATIEEIHSQSTVSQSVTNNENTESSSHPNEAQTLVVSQRCSNEYKQSDIVPNYNIIEQLPVVNVAMSTKSVGQYQFHLFMVGSACVCLCVYIYLFIFFAVNDEESNFSDISQSSTTTSIIDVISSNIDDTDENTKSTKNSTRKRTSDECTHHDTYKKHIIDYISPTSAFLPYSSYSNQHIYDLTVSGHYCCIFFVCVYVCINSCLIYRYYLATKAQLHRR